MCNKATYRCILYCGLFLVLMTHFQQVKAQELYNYVVTDSADSADSTEEILEAAAIVKSPSFAIKTNFAQWGAGVSNIGIEIPIKSHFSIDIPFTYSPYTISDDWKLRLLILQPEARYWFSKRVLRGHFVGIHAQAGYFNVAVDSENRYHNYAEEPLWGAGISYGYSFKLAKNLNMEINVGGGYSSLRYDVFYNIDNGAKFDYQTISYWGVTRAGISLTYIINSNK